MCKIVNHIFTGLWIWFKELDWRSTANSGGTIDEDEWRLTLGRIFGKEYVDGELVIASLYDISLASLNAINEFETNSNTIQETKNKSEREKIRCFVQEEDTS